MAAALSPPRLEEVEHGAPAQSMSPLVAGSPEPREDEQEEEDDLLHVEGVPCLDVGIAAGGAVQVQEVVFVEVAHT